MKTDLFPVNIPLFPFKSRFLGYLLTFSGIILLILKNVIDEFKIILPVLAVMRYSFKSSSRHFFEILPADTTITIIGVLLIAGLFLIAFSKEKIEDEYITRLRLDSLLWAVYFNFGFLIFSLIFVWGFCIADILEINTITVLVIFIIRFKYLLFKSRRAK